MSKTHEVFMCQICGAQVSKRKSFKYKEGRACKHHEEARELFEFRKEATLAKKRAGQGSRGRTIHDRIKKTREISDWGKTHCWICKCEGVEGNEFWKTILATQNTEVEENPTDLLKKAEIKGKKILIQCPFSGTNMFKKFDRMVSREASLTGYAVICPDCARKHKLDPDFLISASANIDLDYLEKFDINVIEQIEALI